VSFCKEEIGVEGRWKWRSRWREGDEGTKVGSVWVMTRLGTYLKVLRLAEISGQWDGRVLRILEEMCGGVAKMTCLNGPNVEVAECNVYADGNPEMLVMVVEMWVCGFGIEDVSALTTTLNP
jgi:hypothetical protein